MTPDVESCYAFHWLSLEIDDLLSQVVSTRTMARLSPSNGHDRQQPLRQGLMVQILDEGGLRKDDCDRRFRRLTTESAATTETEDISSTEYSIVYIQ